MDDLKEFARAGEAAVREAGRYLRANLGRVVETTYKGAVDLVTPFDVGAQEILVGRLSSAFPSHGFLAEEGLERSGTSDCRWVIDPLDGTTNFAHAFPVFCVSAALECSGRLALGFVYDPMRDEMFRAEAGNGAYLNGAAIRVSGVSDLGRSLLATGFPYDVRLSPENNLDHWARLHRPRPGHPALRFGGPRPGLRRVRPFRRLLGAQAQTLGRGRGGPAGQEAGGRVTDFAGQAFALGSPGVVATNGLIHPAVVEVLNMPGIKEGGDDL